MIIHVLTKVGALFFMLAVGALTRVRRIVTDDVLDSLCRIVLNVTLPFLFIYILSAKCGKDTFFSLWMAPFFAAAIILTGYAIGSIAASMLKVPAERRGTFTLLISFQNSGFLAIPIAFALFAEEGVLTVTMFSIGFNLLYWTFGVWLFNRSNASGANLFKNLVNPAIIALMLGLIFGISCVRLPRFFLDASRILGNATIPLAMLIVGAMLASRPLKGNINLKEVCSIAFCRLILVPLVFLGIAAYFRGITPIVRSIIVLEACMPSASTSPLLARRFGGDYNLAANAVFVTTLCSMITVPIFLSLI